MLKKAIIPLLLFFCVFRAMGGNFYGTDYNDTKPIYTITNNIKYHNIYVSTQNTNYPIVSKNANQDNKRIGYTTNINVTSCKNDGTIVYQPVYYDHSSSTYSNGPRKMKVYDENGNEYDTGNEKQGNPTTMWEDGYEYRWDGTFWWRSNDGGRTWERWHTSLNLWYHWWSFFHEKPDKDAITMYEENPMPIDNDSNDTVLFIFGIVSLYSCYKYYQFKEKIIYL
jgi:hypothetical protein